MKELNVPSTLFCTTNFIRGEEFLWVDRLEFTINETGEKHVENFLMETITLRWPIGNVEEKREPSHLSSLNLKTQNPQSYRDSVTTIEQELKKKLDSVGFVPDIYRPLNVNEILEMDRSGLVSIGSHTDSPCDLSPNVKRGNGK